MIKGRADYGLHMAYQLHPFVLKSYMPQPYLPCHHYELFFVPPYCCYNLIAIIPSRLLISISSFWSRSLTRRMWVEQAVRFDFWLTRKDYLQINAFLNLVVVEQEEYPHVLQRKVIGGGVTSKVVRRRLARYGQAWLLGRQCKKEVARTKLGYVLLQGCSVWLDRMFRSRSREQKCKSWKGVPISFLIEWRIACHVKCRCRIIGGLISIKVLWKSFHPNTPIKGEL